jgi:hypothetical protein
VNLGDYFRIFLQMFVEPAQGFRTAFAKPTVSVLMPLGIVVIGTTILNAYYYYHVDITWLGNLLTENLSPAQRKVVSGLFSPSHLLLVSFISVLIVPACVDAVRAFVFSVVLKLMAKPTDYSSLFKICAWAAMPLTLVLPAGILNMYLSGDHVAPSDLNPVSLNHLLFNLSPTDPWAQFFTTLTLVGFWEIGLHAVGLRTRTGISTRAAILLAIVPVVVVYAVWALVIIARSGT